MTSKAQAGCLTDGQIDAIATARLDAVADDEDYTSLRMVSPEDIRYIVREAIKAHAVDAAPVAWGLFAKMADGWIVMHHVHITEWAARAAAQAGKLELDHREWVEFEARPLYVIPEGYKLVKIGDGNE